MVKNPPTNAGDVGSIPAWVRSCGKGNGNPHQYSCLVGDSPWGCRRVRHDLATKQQKQQLEKGSNNLSASDFSFH